MSLNPDDNETFGVVPQKRSIPAPPILGITAPTSEESQRVGRSPIVRRGRDWRKGASVSSVLQRILGAHEPLPFEQWIAQGFDFTKFLAPIIPVPSQISQITQRGYSFVFAPAIGIVVATGSLTMGGRADRITVVSNLSMSANAVAVNGAGRASFAITDLLGNNKQVFMTEHTAQGGSTGGDAVKVAYIKGPLVMLPGERIDVSNNYDGLGIAGDTLQVIVTWDMLEFPVGYNGWGI